MGAHEDGTEVTESLKIGPAIFVKLIGQAIEIGNAIDLIIYSEAPDIRLVNVVMISNPIIFDDLSPICHDREAGGDRKGVCAV